MGAEAEYAFPFVGAVEVHYGLSIRDYFAGQALAGLVAKQGFDLEKKIANQAYQYADAMMAEREADNA